MFMGFKTLADLVILDIDEYDIILGMSWLLLCLIVLDYYARTVNVAMPGMEKLVCKGTFKPSQVRVVTTISQISEERV